MWIEALKGYLYARDDQKPSPPDGLAQYYQCKRWNTLPFSGGYQDQPHLWMELFETIEYELHEYDLFMQRAAERRRQLEEELNKQFKK